MRRDSALDALRIAARRDLNASERDHAAVDLLGDGGDGSSVSDALIDSAATSVLVGHAREIDPALRSAVLGGAIRNGDGSDVVQLAASIGPHDAPSIALGAVECIAGKVPDGMSLLRRSSDGSLRVAAMQAVCDGSSDIAGYLKNFPGSHDLFAYVLAITGDRWASVNDDLASSSDAQLAKLILLDRQGERSAQRYLAALSPEGGTPISSARAGYSPWGLLEDVDLWPDAPEWAEHAATTVDALGSNAPTSDYQGLAQPSLFQLGAAYLNVVAAYGWARRGNLSRSLTCATRAVAFARVPAVRDADKYSKQGIWSLAIASLELAGDWADAAAELEQRAASDANGAIQRALALAHLGKFAEADAALTYALSASDNSENKTKMTAAWLHGAFSLVLDHSTTSIDALPKSGEGPSDCLAYWIAVAYARPSTQALARWRAHLPLDELEDLPEAMPAVYYVLGRAAGSGDVELWLDVADVKTTADAQAVAAARAEAARWRADTASEKRWTDRLAAIRALPKNDREAYLLRWATR